jgi:hypothetical protein
MPACQLYGGNLERQGAGPIVSLGRWLRSGQVSSLRASFPPIGCVALDFPFFGVPPPMTQP